MYLWRGNVEMSVSKEDRMTERHRNTSLFFRLLLSIVSKERQQEVREEELKRDKQEKEMKQDLSTTPAHSHLPSQSLNSMLGICTKKT